ncbi:spore germination protein [Gottfriedia luciferensis]|uniref:spore germination protein n=1 Tax=Gottfriedia luciferensis TaxID=178774 RepID=UPI000B452DC2|nr:spore germination protein [Gottfriedia luciferensis]
MLNYKKVNSSVRNNQIPFQGDLTRTLSKDINENINRIKSDLGDSSDLIIRQGTIGRNIDHSYAIIRIDGISNEEVVNEGIIEKIVCLNFNSIRTNTKISLVDLENGLKGIIAVSSLKSLSSYTNLLTALLLGDTIILLNQDCNFLVACTKMVQSRDITEPSTQTIIRGPKDSFIESLRTNTSLIRNRIQHAALRLETFKVGEVTRTDVEIMYIQGIVDQELLKEVKKRITSINVDAIIDSSYIEKYIHNDQKTFFPTSIFTERPDAAVGNLLEGRIIILIAGSPFVMIIPATFNQFFQSPEDYYQSTYVSTFIRMLRYLCFLLTMFVPGVFVAVNSFHQGIIPTVLLVTFAAQREGVPLPLIVEAIIMEIVFELLREAGVRMPRLIGQTLSIVGALILGQAAVQAGFISNSMIIIVAITAISSFAIPYYNMGIVARIFRYAILLAGAYIGLLGVFIVGVCTLIHLCSLRTFSEPYFAPFAPFRFKSQRDTILVLPPGGNPNPVKEQSKGE